MLALCCKECQNIDFWRPAAPRRHGDAAVVESIAELASLALGARPGARLPTQALTPGAPLPTQAPTPLNAAATSQATKTSRASRHQPGDQNFPSDPSTQGAREEKSAGSPKGRKPPLARAGSRSFGRALGGHRLRALLAITR